MVEKIFNALKQEFSYLGLGDSVLRPYAESLGACGFVTDDNLNDVVSKQKSSLEAIQKANDKRAADAMKTAEEKAEAKRKAELYPSFDSQKAVIHNALANQKVQQHFQELIKRTVVK